MVSPSAQQSLHGLFANTTCSFCIHTSCTIWSYALCRKEEYTANTGVMPPFAKPAASCAMLLRNGNVEKTFRKGSLKFLKACAAAHCCRNPCDLRVLLPDFHHFIPRKRRTSFCRPWKAAVLFSNQTHLRHDTPRDVPPRRDSPCP